MISFWKGLSLGLQTSFFLSPLLSPSPSLKEAAKYFSLFANTLFSALTTPDTFLNKLIDNHPCDGGCQGINGFPAANQRAPAPAPEPSLARGFCMKGGGACRAAEPSPAERCARSGAGEAGPQPAACSRPRGNLCISLPQQQVTAHACSKEVGKQHQDDSSFPPLATEYWLPLGYIREDGTRGAGARVGQGPWVVQGDSPTSISGSWQGRRWCAIVPPLIRGTALGSSPSSHLGANTLSAPLLTVGQEVRPKPRASAPSWLPSHLLGSQSVLCPCGPLQSRARARPCSQPSPSLAQVWLKEPQHVSSILTPSSTSLSHPECAEAKLELSSHSPSNSHPRHKRIFSGGSFR